MIPKIKVNVGRGHEPVELQQVIDTDLLTRNKTVVGSINELYYEIKEGEEARSSVYNANTLSDFPDVGDVNTIYKAESEKMLYQWNPTELKYETLGAFAPENGVLLETITQEMVDKWNTAAPIDHNHDGAYLKANEIIPAALLPGFVDDVIEVVTAAELPITGEAGKIYVVTSENKSYRWSGTQYVELSKGVALGETAETAFRGDLGKIAYEHAISEHIEVFKMVDTVLPVKEKTIHIPKASATSYGVVKSSSGANKVSVESDGTMKVGVVTTSSLKVPIGEVLVLNGGTANNKGPDYSTRINNIGYDSVSEAVAAANYGDVVTIQNDVNLGTKDNEHLVVNAENVTLELASSKLTSNGSNGAINVTGGSTTITGDGTVEGTLGSDNYSMAVWASSGKVVIDGGTYKNATDGSDRGTDLIYASGDAVIEITGGTFIAAKPEWTLNCRDADYKAGTANIIVKGGRFYKFDPANNNTEGVGTNYVAEGYKSTKDGDYYVVTPIA